MIVFWLGAAHGRYRRWLCRLTLHLQRSSRVRRWIDGAENANEPHKMYAQRVVALFHLKHLEHAVE